MDYEDVVHVKQDVVHVSNGRLCMSKQDVVQVDPEDVVRLRRRPAEYDPVR
jgi:hypothetical protein